MKSKWITALLLVVVLILGLGAALAATFGAQGNFWTGWLGTSAVLVISLGAAAGAWGLSTRLSGDRGDRRWLAGLVALAFCLRLGVGLFMMWGLPLFGYENSHTANSGYFYFDAYQRDQQAWDLAISGQPLTVVFQKEFQTDQYGGLLLVSALVYRLFSPDVQRNYLIVIIAAGATAAGVPFLWAALRRRWGAGLARLATWIFVLYPEALFLGSAAMREPFMIALGAVAFWAAVAAASPPGRAERSANPLPAASDGARQPAAVASGLQRWVWPAIAFVASLVVLFLFSPRVALPLAGMCLVWFLLDGLGRSQFRLQGGRRLEILSWAGLLVAGVVMGVGSWAWLASSIPWEAYIATAKSGVVAGLFKTLPAQLHIPFLTAYGLVQPVLPATLTDPAPWIWQVFNSLRAAGWYILTPVLLYASFALWRVKDGGERRLLAWAAGTAWLWIIISSMRAGGDQWDNPRYRTIFIIWLAFLAAWGWRWGRQNKDPWLWRWLAVEGIFTLVMLHWYLTRYFPVLGHLSLTSEMGVVGLLSVLVLAGGWVWDRIRRVS
jgi:hypothetical protein